MIGMEHLEALRRRGYIPAAGVIVWCSEHPLKRCTIRTPWADPADVAEVIVGADDQPARLDLRALVGLPVVVSGPNEKRREIVARAVFAAGAAGAITDENGAYIGSIEEAAHG